MTITSFVLGLLVGGGASGAAAAAWLGRAGGWLRAPRARGRQTLLPLPSAMVPPGARGEVVRLRVRLREVLIPARELVGNPRPDNWLSTDLSVLLQRAEALAVTVDSQLRLLESEPDPVMVTSLLPRMRHRTDELATAIQGLRELATARVETALDQQLDELTADTEREAALLRGTVDAYRDLIAPPQLAESARLSRDTAKGEASGP